MKRMKTIGAMLAAFLLCFGAVAASSADLEALTITGGDANALKVLKDYPNLKSLTLADCPAYDLSAVASCAKLTALTISWSDGYAGGAAYDLSPLIKCSRLNTLTLTGQGIDDLSALPDIPKLTALVIESTAVSDYSPIAELSLKHLRLFGADADAVAAVFTGIGRRLESASVGDCTLTPEANDAILTGTNLLSLGFADAEGIDGGSARWAKLTKLTSLTINGGSVSGLEFCDEYVSTVVVKLADVFIGGSVCSVDFDKHFLIASDVLPDEMLKLVGGSGRRWQYATVRQSEGEVSADTIAAFAGVSSLLSLDVQAAAPDAFTQETWKGFPKLEQLKLSDCTAVSLEMLKELPGLLRLSIRNAAVSAAETIGSLYRLQQLSLVNCTLEDWAFLDVLGNTKLSLLSLSGCDGPATIAFIKDLTKLRVLALEYALLTDLAPLAGLPLESLYLYGCDIADYAPLQSLASLKLLYCNADAALPMLNCRIEYRPVIVEER
ncbi:MAG: hypothetical protein JW811_07100 [Clostridiales bacterium]|nr:hypothetical protein [Clostridiales bacterium]